MIVYALMHCVLKGSLETLDVVSKHYVTCCGFSFLFLFSVFLLFIYYYSQVKLFVLH